MVHISVSEDKNKLREILKKLAVEGLPVALSYPLKQAIKKMNISEGEKEILKSLVEGGTYAIEKGFEKPIEEIIDDIFEKIKE